MDNRIILPIDNIEVRSSQHSKKPKLHIKGRAKIIPGKKYAYKYDSFSDGTPNYSMKEVISTEGWERIKKKIMAKNIFVDESHKTVAELQLKRLLNDLGRETGKDLNEYKDKINDWLNISKFPLFKLEEAELYEDGVEFDISMNPFFKDIDPNHAAYYDAVEGSIKEGILNSISLNFNPSDVEQRFDAHGNEIIPVIHDADVFGISILANPAYDDMYDVLDVAVRSAQHTITEKNKGVGSMDKQEPKTETPETDMKKLQAELEELKKQNEEKEKLLREQEDAAKQAEMQRLIEEKEKAEDLLRQRDAELQRRNSTGSRGFAPQPPQSSGQWKEEFKDKLKDLSLGELIVLQGEYNTIKHLPPETLSSLRVKDSIRIPAKNSA